jgi:hypothetical protein
MADRLYLSLWYPNFRLEALPSALTGVLRQFSAVGARRVSAASAYPINFTEPPTYQRIYVDSQRGGAPDDATPVGPGIPPSDASDSAIETAVAEATEQLHDDMAYEFEMRWQLWSPEEPPSNEGRLSRSVAPDTDSDENDLGADSDFDRPVFDDADTLWKLRPHTVRILGFGPNFDMAGYEQNGRKELRHLQPPALDRVRRAARREAHRAAAARALTIRRPGLNRRSARYYRHE